MLFKHDLTCLTCGVKYLGRKATQKYCSVGCVKLPGRPKKTGQWKMCANCGKFIYRYPAREGYKRFFCGQECKLNGMKGANHPSWRGGKGVEYACEKCGKSFYAKYNSKKPRRFCSYGCAKTEIPGRKSTGASKTFECEYCGKKIIRYKVRWHTRQFCSYKCKGLGTRGDKSPNWKGGLCPYYGEEWHEVRRVIRKKYKSTCQNCGITRKQLGQYPDVHHKIPVRDFNGDLKRAHAVENLTLLCRGCHQIIERTAYKSKRYVAIMKEWNRLMREGLSFDGPSNLKHGFDRMSRLFGKDLLSYLAHAYAARGDMTDTEFCELNGNVPPSLITKRIKPDAEKLCTLTIEKAA